MGPTIPAPEVHFWFLFFPSRSIDYTESRQETQETHDKTWVRLQKVESCHMDANPISHSRPKCNNSMRQLCEPQASSPLIRPNIIDWNNTTQKSLRINRRHHQIRLGVCNRPRNTVEHFQADSPGAKTHISLQRLHSPLAERALKLSVWLQWGSRLC